MFRIRFLNSGTVAWLGLSPGLSPTMELMAGTVGVILFQ